MRLSDHLKPNDFDCHLIRNTERNQSQFLFLECTAMSLNLKCCDSSSENPMTSRNDMQQISRQESIPILG